jgi:hypothetical protein
MTNIPSNTKRVYDYLPYPRTEKQILETIIKDLHNYFFYSENGKLLGMSIEGNPPQREYLRRRLCIGDYLPMIRAITEGDENTEHIYYKVLIAINHPDAIIL